MLHYVKFLQVFLNKNALTSAKCEEHGKRNLIVLNGRTGGLTRTHTSYACSPQCLWDQIMDTRWEQNK